MKTILKGLNQSVVAQITKDTVKTFEYDDYGNSSKKEGHGYNSEYKDETGFIYLRARHYDPSIARFVSVDNNYAGEEKEVNTQNRYVYTLNDPYKYVDRDGNKAKKDYVLEVSSKIVNGGRYDTYYYKSGKKEFKFVPDKKTPPPPPVPPKTGDPTSIPLFLGLLGISGSAIAKAALVSNPYGWGIAGLTAIITCLLHITGVNKPSKFEQDSVLKEYMRTIACTLQILLKEQWVIIHYLLQHGI